MCRLRFFEVNIDFGSATTYDFGILSFLIGSLFISLSSPATLEHLEFNIWFLIDNFVSDTFCENLRDADVWGHLDSIATHPAGSLLRRVDINIDYSFLYDDDGDYDKTDEDEILKAVLDGLPLLRTKGILFVEVALE